MEDGEDELFIKNKEARILKEDIKSERRSSTVNKTYFQQKTNILKTVDSKALEFEARFLDGSEVEVLGEGKPERRELNFESNTDCKEETESNSSETLKIHAKTKVEVLGEEKPEARSAIF